jgi:hypothetical protein
LQNTKTGGPLGWRDEPTSGGKIFTTFKQIHEVFNLNIKLKSLQF